MVRWPRPVAWALFAACSALVVLPALRSEPVLDVAAAEARLLEDARKGPDLPANLGHLADVIGPRLTGSEGLRRATDWASETMQKYGLSNVHTEPWSLTEGWKRGSATGRVVEPGTGRALTLASYGWTPGTAGKVTGPVVILNARTVAELEPYRGKLKGAIVLNGNPAKLRPYSEVDQPLERAASAIPPGRGDGQPSREQMRELVRMRQEFLIKEGAVALVLDSGKHFNLVTTTSTGNLTGTDRPSATNRLPILTASHDHFALLHRLASRPAPAVTRVEVEVSNEFVAGPIAVHNVVGEIPGREKPDEVVLLGAHLDSWDLGQGVLDNGTGTCIVLEAARLLRKHSLPRRTIRFVLFTGEEQGLLGSKAYVQRHKETLPKHSAALIHDVGTGKVTGLGWQGRPVLQPLLEAELGRLKELGVKDLYTRGFGGSDHIPFDQAGVPACICRQESAGYTFAHHTPADTLEMVREADVRQGAQVLAVAALRLANRDGLLPREKADRPAAGKRP